MSPPRTVVLVRRPAGGTRKRTTARRRPARRRRSTRLKPAQWWPVVLVALVVVVGLAWDADGQDAAVPTDSCTLPASGVTLTGEELANARTIAQVAWDRGLPERAVVIALATAMQESHLRNLDHGDRDSLGLFQQRPSQGWGTPEQVQDPVYAAGKFYDHLIQYPGWDTGDLTTVADGIQRSAFPLAYRKWETMAQELASAISDDNYPCT
jgi:hypothetical protein